MAVSYPWYDLISDGQLQQGDIVLGLDVPVIREVRENDSPIDIEQYDIIVMTQSCDIPKHSIKQIVMCPIWKVSDLAKDYTQFDDENYLEDLRRGRDYKYHLLDKCDINGFECDFRVVQFERPMTMKKETVITEAKSRSKYIRLLPPYREEMSQRFGLYFSRVAKPIDIPEFKKAM